MKNLIFVCLLIVVMYVSCKKEKDTITQHDIKGMVFNNCTDSGLANVTVFLQDGQGLNLSTVSDANGNFSFNNVSINNNSKYNYNLYIPSKSGGISSNPNLTEIGINGTRMYFNYDEVDIFFKPRVSPKFLLFVVYCNKTPITSTNDSIIFYCNNYIFRKNVPDYPYRWGGGIWSRIIY